MRQPLDDAAPEQTANAAPEKSETKPASTPLQPNEVRADQDGLIALQLDEKAAGCRRDQVQCAGRGTQKG